MTMLGLLIGSTAIVTGAGVWFLVGGPASNFHASVPAQVLSATDQYREVPTLNVLLKSEQSTDSQTFVCQKTSCRPQNPPLTIPVDSAFDGQAWYYYAGDHSLHQRTISGADTLVVSPTGLVTPRDALVNSRGTALAYWLDNITEKEKKLTELWVYDSAAQDTRVVAENLVGTDIVTPLRWNSSGTALMFVANSGLGGQEKLEFVVANAQPAHTQARFQQIDIEDLQQAAEAGKVDVSPSGTSVALVTPEADEKETLLVTRDNGSIQRTTISGTVPYLQWMSENTLLYAVQQSGEIEFMRWVDGVSAPIGHERGQFISGLADETGKYIAYVSREESHVNQLRVLEVKSELSRVQSTLLEGSNLQVVHIDLPERVPSVTAQLSDGQLIAFIERQAANIVEEGSRLVRIVTTEVPNTLFVDYVTPHSASKRILLTVRDAVYPEWVVQARYEPVGGEWRKAQGDGASEPKPVKLYEWEENLQKWILKSSF